MVKYDLIVLFQIIIVIMAISYTLSAPIQLFSKDYLSQSGYLRQTSDEKSVSDNLLNKTIMDFQHFSRLNITDELNEETIEQMSRPRCSINETIGSNKSSRTKRYRLDSNRWNTTDLTYRITKYSAKLNKSDVDKEIARAFKLWSRYTDLTFTVKLDGPVDIKISFEIDNHGDPYPFDHTDLAHAFFPSMPDLRGIVHFNDYHNWTIGQNHDRNGKVFVETAVHELGHTLGLHHSSSDTSIMYPFEVILMPYIKLDEDDIKGIQALYGPKTSNPIDDDDDKLFIKFVD